MTAQQPEREPDDGAVNIGRRGGKLVVSVETGGLTHELVMSDFNAWRVFGMLSLMLGIELPAKLRKAIKL